MALGYGRTGSNQFACAKFIVDTNGLDKGATHTTIAGALTDASSGDTIFIKPGTYTENLTLAAGVNLTASPGDELTPNVTIVGKATATFAGTCTISNIRLQTNSDNLLVVSGTSATIVHLNNCYLNCSNNTGISYSTSSSSSEIRIYRCRGDLGTTGIKFFDSTSAGTIYIEWSSIQNSGGSSTYTTASAGNVYVSNASEIDFPIQTSGTAGMVVWRSRIENSSVVPLIVGGSGGNGIDGSILAAGSNASLTVTDTCGVYNSFMNSSNTTAIVNGAGTLNYSSLYSNSTTGTITTSTQNGTVTRLGCYRAAFQKGCYVYNSSQLNNVTGDGTVYTLAFNTEYYDRGATYNTGTYTFTAPFDGIYDCRVCIRLYGLTSSHTKAKLNIVYTNTGATAKDYSTFVNPYATSNGTEMSMQVNSHIYLFATETIHFTIAVYNGTKVVDILTGGATEQLSWASVLLVS